MSSPVIQVWDGVLTAPLIGTIDSRRATAIMESVLDAIVRYQADVLILDITGVAVVDTAVVNYLLSTARAVKLLGCHVVLTGISGNVAQTIVQLGVDLSQLVTKANLKEGIVWAFAQLELRVFQERQGDLSTALEAE